MSDHDVRDWLVKRVILDRSAGAGGAQQVPTPPGEAPHAAPPNQQGEPSRHARAEALAQIARELNATLDLPRQLEALQRHILRLAPLAGCWIAICDDVSDTVLILNTMERCDSLPARLTLRTGPGTQPTTMYEVLLLEGRPILTDDYVAECRRRSIEPLGKDAALPGRAWFGMPLRVGDRIIGALAVWRWHEPIDAEAIEGLQEIAAQSATALDNARLYAAAQQRHREEAAFNAIAQDLTASLESDAILDHIARHARALLNGDFSCVRLHDPERGRLRVRAHDGDFPNSFDADLLPGEGLSGHVWATKRTIVSPDVLADPRFPLPDALAHGEADAPRWSAIAAPALLGEEFLGTLTVGKRERQPFTTRDEAILARLATQAALGVRNARLFAAERARATRAEALREIGRDLSADLDLSRFLLGLQQHLARLTGLDNCWVGLCDEAHGAQLLFWVEEGRRRPESEGPLSLPLPPSMFREVVEAGATILTDDYVRECERRGLPTAGFRADRPHRAWVGLPLQIRGRTIGALAVWRWDGPIELAVVELLETLVRQIAAALENARLYDATERQRREEAAFSAIARDLAASLDGELVLDQIVRHARALLGGDTAHITLFDATSGLLQLCACDDDDPASLAQSMRPGEGLTGYAWQAGQPITSTEYFADPRFAPPPGQLPQRATSPGRSAIAVPIALADERLGVLLVGKRAQHEFTARDEAILARLATQAALGVRNARLFAAERARATRAEALREIGRDLSANLQLDRLLEATRHHLLRLGAPENFWVALLDDEAEALRMHLWVEEGTPREPRESLRPLPLGPSIIATVLDVQHPIVTDDYAAECARLGVIPRGPNAELAGRAWGCFPLIASGKSIGALAIWRWHTPLSAELCETIELFAGQMAAALENARLYEAAERQRREETAFSAIASDLAASLDRTTLLQRIADHALALFAGKGAAIMLHDPAADLLRVVAGSGDAQQIVGVTARPDEGMSGLIWQSGRPFSTANYGADRRFPHNPAFASHDAAHGPQAILGVPIALAERVLGVLVVMAGIPRRFTARDEALLARLAAQTALAEQNARLYAEAQARAARLEVLNAIAQELSVENDFEHFLSTVWQHVRRILPVDGCWVALWRAAAEELQYCLYVEDDARLPEWEQTIARSSGNGLAWAIIEEQATICVDDYNAECRRRGLTPFGTDPDLPNSPWLGLPLLVNGHLVGAMALWRREGRFTDEERLTLTTLANQLAATMENARLYQEARALALTDPLTGLLNHRQMMACLDQELSRASRHGRPLAVMMLDLDNFKLFNDTYGHPTGDQILRATADILRAEIRAGDISARYGGDEFCLILPETSREGALALIERLQRRCHSIGVPIETVPSLPDQGEGTLPLRISAGIAVYPTDARDRHELMARADVALYANKRGGRSFPSTSDLEQSRVDDPLVSNASFGVIEGLVLAVDAKDHYTVAHSQLVADAAVLLGEALGLPGRDLAILRTAGLLHDVGKISIPDRILRKPGQLTHDEWQVMRQHVEFSELIIRGVPGLQEILEPVMHHHERWDGGGYPRGLAGEAVPLLGRIMVLADAFSAMTLDRPYRRGLPLHDALAQLRAGAGQQFDPALVAPFCDAITPVALEQIVSVASHA